QQQRKEPGREQGQHAEREPAARERAPGIARYRQRVLERRARGAQIQGADVRGIEGPRAHRNSNPPRSRLKSTTYTSPGASVTVARRARLYCARLRWSWRRAAGRWRPAGTRTRRYTEDMPSRASPVGGTTSWYSTRPSSTSSISSGERSRGHSRAARM